MVRVRTCVIFNPTARGDKARLFREQLARIARDSVLKLTSGPGHARLLATEAVIEGFETIVAAGGDGTVHEVLNGIGGAPGGFERARLGLLPLGTINVFARELEIPSMLELAWRTVLQGCEARIDLPSAEFSVNGKPQKRWFAQLAGAGLDARAVELVSWVLKRRIGPLAYVWAGLQAMATVGSRVTVSGGGTSNTGGLVLIGNGRLYGGNYRVFPKADLKDGLLDICVFPRVNWLTLARCGPQILLRGTLPESSVHHFCAESIELASETRTPLELDGEFVGVLPARLTVKKLGLRVIVP